MSVSTVISYDMKVSPSHASYWMTKNAAPIMTVKLVFVRMLMSQYARPSIPLK